MRRVLNIAHRGFTREYPDNTLEALDAAIGLGVDGVEFDVRETADGEFVLFHDPELRGAAIRALTLGQVREVRLKGGYKIPTLAEALQLCANRTRLFVELKETVSFDCLVALLKSQAPLSDVMLLSFNGALLRELLYRAPDIPRAVIVVSPGKDPLGMMEPVQADSIVVKYPFVSRKLVGAVHDVGRAVFVWGLPLPWCIDSVVAAGVDGIISDFPDVVKKKLGGKLLKRRPIEAE